MISSTHHQVNNLFSIDVISVHSILSCHVSLLKALWEYFQSHQTSGDSEDIYFFTVMTSIESIFQSLKLYGSLWKPVIAAIVAVKNHYQGRAKGLTPHTYLCMNTRLFIQASGLQKKERCFHTSFQRSTMHFFTLAGWAEPFLNGTWINKQTYGKCEGIKILDRTNTEVWDIWLLLSELVPP